MTVEQFGAKIKRWEKRVKNNSRKAVKDVLRRIEQEAKSEYSGKTIGLRTGKTRAAIKTEFKSEGGRITEARVFVDEPRTFIAIFHETKNRAGLNYPRRPVWEPLEKKYKPKIVKRLLKETMRAYG